MVASLVMVLPVLHIGGNLVITHGQKVHTFTSEHLTSSNVVSCIAFYSDCKHKIGKVKEGYRIALTYNLTLQSGNSPHVITINQPLQEAVSDYFSIKKIQAGMRIHENWSIT